MTKNAMDWFVGKMEREAGQVQKILPKLKPTSTALYHIRHGAEMMALSMGIKRIAYTSPDRLYLWSVKRYAREARKRGGEQCSLEVLAQFHLFYYGRDIVAKRLKGGVH